METKFDLTNFELFKNLSELALEEYFFDLHNDFKCNKVIFAEHQQNFMLGFDSINLKQRFTIVFDFREVIIQRVNIEFENLEDFNTINNIYRGRFETNEGLTEISDAGKRLFYIEFENGSFFEISCLLLNVSLVKS